MFLKLNELNLKPVRFILCFLKIYISSTYVIGLTAGDYITCISSHNNDLKCRYQF